MTAVESVPVAAPRRRGGLLRHRDFRLLFIGETTSALGTSVKGITLSLVAVSVLHGGTFTVSLLVALGWLPWVVIGLPAGAWIDRMRRRRVMLVCDAVSLLVFLSVPVAAWCGVLGMGQLLIVAIVAGTATVFFETAYTVYLPSLVSEADLTEGNAKLRGSASATQVAGPGLGGLIAQSFGAVLGLVANAASFAVSAACLLLIRGREPVVKRSTDAPRERGALGREIREGVRFVVHDPYLRAMALLGGIGNLALTGYQSVLVVFLVRVVHVESGLLGVLMAVTSCGGVVGAMAVRRVTRRFGSARGLLLTATLGWPFGLLIPMTSRGPGLLFFAVGGFVVIASVVAGSVIQSGFRQAYSPRVMLGRITVSIQVLNYGLIPVGAMLGGALGSAFGPRTAIWVMTGLLTVTPLVLFTGPLRRCRDLPERPAPAV